MPDRLTVLSDFGTRPKAIELAPVVNELENHPDQFHAPRYQQEGPGEPCMSASISWIRKGRLASSKLMPGAGTRLCLMLCVEPVEGPGRTCL